jgi:hypothetical protein
MPLRDRSLMPYASGSATVRARPLICGSPGAILGYNPISVERRGQTEANAPIVRRWRRGPHPPLSWLSVRCQEG